MNTDNYSSEHLWLLFIGVGPLLLSKVKNKQKCLRNGTITVNNI